ncbi:MAG: cell wall hydrolase [Lachnospiraceae bacterium]|nr:cell wall hydrolase [Lachnospiraceae bacterium]
MLRKKKKKLVAVVIAVCMFTMGLPQMTAYATGTLEQLQNAQQQMQQMQQEKEEIDEERQELQGELGGLEQQHGSLKSELNSLNEELAEAAEHLAELEAQIAEKEAEIAQTKKELEEAKQAEADQYEAMQNRMQASYESPDSEYLEMLLSARSISELLNFADYISMLADYDNQVLLKYQATKEAVAAKEVALEQELAELEVLKQANLDEQERINALIQTTADYVQKYAAQISTAEAELAEIEAEIARKEAEIAAQEADIEALKKKYQEELLMSQLANSSAKRDISQVVFEEGDRYLLANLIYCEAGGEPYEGQLAVGAVVINRVLSSVYPNTVSGVIYQRRQFSPVASGRLALALSQNKATPSCYQAADAAMSGQTNVGGCVYFRTPIPGLTGIQIGGHIFY